MPRNASFVAPGLRYPITERTTHGQRIFPTDSDRETYMKLLASNKYKAGVRILTW